MNEVTARKWRPQLFKDFVGQDYVIHSLKQSIKESKLAHGYLFAGPRGTGKTSTARVLSAALNCLDLSSEIEPCLKCKNCLEIRAGNSPDVIEIDGASNRGIDDMREMRSNIQFMPSYSKYKIYIIDEVHMLTTEAFNSILKVLEEPPSYLVFMFATTEVHKVKNTIRSRCQQFYLKRLTEEQITEQLQKILTSYNITYQKEALALIARAADGSMRDSQSILDQAIIFSEGMVTVEKVKEILGTTSYEELIKFLQILVAEDGRRMKEFSQELYIRGEDLSFFIFQVIEIFRGLLLIEYKAENTLHFQDDVKQVLMDIAPHFTKYQLQSLIDLFMGVFKDIKETDQEYFLLEGAFLKALQYKEFVNLKEVITRLALLESQNFKDNETTFSDTPAPLTHSKESIVAKENWDLPPEKVYELWKKSLNGLREQKILLDIKHVRYSNGILKIEFLTREGLERFEEYEGIQENLKSFYQKHQIVLKMIEPYVEIVSLKTQKKETTPEAEDLLSMFMQELDAKEIKDN